MPTLVEVVAYDNGWPLAFAEMSKHIASLLGPTVIAIDHVGSTAVAGLAAKPIIDIDVTICGPEAIAGGSAALVADGFASRGNRYDDGVWAFARHGSPGQRVYLCPPFNDTHRRRLIFRDQLRRSRETADAYAALKRRLAATFSFDGDSYTAAKSQFIDDVVERAGPGLTEALF
ncbi:GrpB family protein [Ensifer sp. 4252]|uniref:GrpB family protein n=1 Tax=Ensifer sp. 4252 TaxID=3373915 RepID=UPI003D1D29E3